MAFNFKAIPLKGTKILIQTKNYLTIVISLIK